MENSEIPQSFLKKHPGLVQVLEALKEYSAGHVVTTQCPICNQVLTVIELSSVGVRTVKCGNGCTDYQERFKLHNSPD